MVIMELEVTLYTRQNCKLCDHAISDLEEIQQEIPHKLILVDIDQDPALVEESERRVGKQTKTLRPVLNVTLSFRYFSCLDYS